MAESKKPPQSNIRLHRSGDAEPHSSAQQMVGRINAGQRRMLAARTSRNHELYHALAILGAVGWSVTVPTLAGVALGIWVDRVYPTRLSWTLILLFLGIAIGCWNAWSHIKASLKG